MSDFTPKNGDYASLIEKINKESLANLRNEVIESQAEHEKHAGKLMSEDAEKHLEKNNYEKEPHNGISELTRSLLTKNRNKKAASSQSTAASSTASKAQSTAINQDAAFEENTHPQGFESIKTSGSKKSEPKGIIIFIIFALVVFMVSFLGEAFEDSDFAPIFPLMFFILAVVLYSRPWRKKSQNPNIKNR